MCAHISFTCSNVCSICTTVNCLHKIYPVVLYVLNTAFKYMEYMKTQVYCSDGPTYWNCCVPPLELSKLSAVSMDVWELHLFSLDLVPHVLYMDKKLGKINILSSPISFLSLEKDALKICNSET